VRATGLIAVGVAATILVIFADGRSRVFDVAGILVLAFIVLFGGYTVLRLLLTKPARRRPELPPRADVPRRWGFGAFDPDQQRSVLWGPREWRWSRAARAGGREAK
jgi:hypothetical protein